MKLINIKLMKLKIKKLLTNIKLKLIYIFIIIIVMSLTIILGSIGIVNSNIFYKKNIVLIENDINNLILSIDNLFEKMFNGYVYLNYMMQNSYSADYLKNNLDITYEDIKLKLENRDSQYLKIIQKFENIANQSAVFNQGSRTAEAAFLLDHKGLVVAYNTIDSEYIGMDLSMRDYFINTKETKKQSISKVYKGVTGEEYITYTIPIIENNEFYGLVGLDHSLKFFENTIDLHYGKLGTGSFILIDPKSDYIIAHNLKDYEKKTGLLLVNNKTEMQSLYDIYLSALNKWNTAEKTNGSISLSKGILNGRKVNFKIKRGIGGNDINWDLITIIDEDDLTYDFKSFNYNIFLVLISIGLSLLAILIFIAIKFINYIKFSVHIVHQIEEERYYNAPTNESFIVEIDALYQALKSLKNTLKEKKNAAILNLYKIKNHDLLYHKTITDNLTQIYNREYFYTKLGDLKLNNFYIFIFDLDYFKKVNDVYGHIVGDAVLKTFAQLGKDIFYEKGVFARYGGEEFALLISETTKKDLIKLLKRFQKEFSNYPWDFDEKASFTFSAGGVHINDNREDTDSILNQSDKLLYRAKKEGRNRFIIEPYIKKADQKID